MKKYLVLFSAFLLLFTLSGVAGAYTINNDTVIVGNEYTSPYASNAGFVTEDFEGLSSVFGNAAWTGNYAIVIDTTDINAAPMGFDGVNRDAGWYLTVPDNVDASPQSVHVVLGAQYNYFGLWWGSVDEYNKLELFNNDVWVETVYGLNVNNPANGNQTIYATNKYVNILGLDWFDSFTMTSTQYAFEADNITVGVVPEPTTLLLLGLGLIGLAGVRRKFKK